MIVIERGDANEKSKQAFGEHNEGVYTFSLGVLIRALRRQWPVVGLSTILFVAVAVGSGLAQPPVYETSILMLVEQRREAPEQPDGILELQRLTQTVVSAINTRPVAEATIQRLNLQESPKDFLDNMEVEQLPNTQFVRVYYQATSAQQAERVANTIGEVFSEQISEVNPSNRAISATVWERALAPDTPVSPNPLRRGLIALVLGLTLGVGLAVMLEARSAGDYGRAVGYEENDS